MSKIMLGTKNRFAALKIDDDEDEGSSSKGASANQNQSNAAAKKKNKKKAKEADEALRSMAFGTGRPGTKQQKHPGSGGQRGQGNRHMSADEWAEWQRRDKEATEDMFEQDLQKALLESRLEAEQVKEAQKVAVKEGRALGSAASDSAGGKKKKKKDKPQTMSLDQFNQLPPETLPGSDDENEDPAPPPVHTRVPITCQDTSYFESVTSDASKILQKERIQEQYQKAYAHESAMQSKYQDQIEKLKEKIKELESRLEAQGKELKTVKGRNATLAKILATGEMKEKSSILEEVEELTTDKLHLTEQLHSLNADLEKERSKNHALKLEIDKLKGKHGK
ncbi:G kinase-anchoring protein 1-like [Babylonia areolata]|uniref:G kinase-anchoring protein 1-like n=1 Tax=Babylonia areolata TaxID=304850 RepID=UPI003FD2961D